MKLLFDQNISYRITKKLSESFKYAKHISQVNLNGSTDLEIWNFAKTNKYTIVSFDSDFCDIANLKGHPPKIIWLRIGNTSTQNLVNKLERKADILQEFLNDEDKKEWACLEII